MENQKNSANAKLFSIILIVIGMLIILLGIFWIGMFVGFTKANFSRQWGNNYHRLFEGEPRQKIGPPPRRGNEFFMNANSASGSVIKIEGNTIYLKGDDNVERSVLLLDSAVIRRGKKNIKITEIKQDENLLVLGSPSSTGQIEAKFIRILNK